MPKYVHVLARTFLPIYSYTAQPVIGCTMVEVFRDTSAVPDKGLVTTIATASVRFSWNDNPVAKTSVVCHTLTGALWISIMP